jgi:hypothetical protein
VKVRFAKVRRSASEPSPAPAAEEAG